MAELPSNEKKIMLLKSKILFLLGNVFPVYAGSENNFKFDRKNLGSTYFFSVGCLIMSRHSLKQCKKIDILLKLKMKYLNKELRFTF